MIQRLLPGILLALACSPSLAADSLDRIAAVVDDDVVLQSEVSQRMQDVRHQFLSRQQALPPEEVLREKVLEQLILQRLQLAQAERAGVRIDDASLNTTLTEIAKQNGLDLAGFRNRLESEQAGSYNQVREQVRQEMSINRLRSRRVGERIQISDRDIDNFLASPQGQEALSSEYHLAHIVISLPDAPTPQQIAAARSRAEQALAELRAGKPYADVAVRYSNSEDALQGGDLGWRKAAEMPAVFAEQVARMNKGDATGPIQTPAGLHVLVLLDKRGSEQMMVHQRHTRHILVKASELLSNEDAHQKANDLHERLVKGADFAELAKTYSDDPGSARNGGEVGWVSPGEMVPAFEEMMNKTPINAISPVFESQFGWHILQVTGERDQDMTREYRRNLARQALYNRQYDEQQESWLRELRGEAYVDIKPVTAQP